MIIDIGMLIRPARPADAPAVSHLMRLLGYEDTEGFMAERLEELSHSDNDRVFVAVRDGHIMGVLGLHFIRQLGRRGDFARITYLCIDPDARSQGLGHRLIREAETLSRQRGCDRMEVRCHARRTRAHGFYQREGYTESPKYFTKMLSPTDPAV